GAVRLLTEPVPWPKATVPRRAGVSSFGISGTNAHVLIEEAPPVETQVEAVPLPFWPILLSARSEAALRGQATRLRAHLVDDLGDLAGTLATTRTHFERRAAVVVADGPA